MLQDVVGAMLDEWQENLAIMAANRTVGDERVILHLGDRLWGVRGEVIYIFCPSNHLQTVSRVTNFDVVVHTVNAHVHRKEEHGLTLMMMRFKFILISWCLFYTMNWSPSS